MEDIDQGADILPLALAKVASVLVSGRQAFRLPTRLG